MKAASKAMASAALLSALALAGCNQSAASTGDGMSAEMQTLADRIAIEDMIVGYYALLGSGETSDVGDYYTEDATFDVNGIILTGHDEIESIYDNSDAEEGEQTTPEADDGETFHMLLSNPVINVTGDTATASFVWTGVMNTDIKSPPSFAEQGREYDMLTKVGGHWLITKRVVIADSGLPDSYDETYTPRKTYSITAD